uniref:Uncharacterized protein n=1 Tax=Panagrolaimus davidi TaxID=227884 RepID=A0A914QV05_9BILA
METAASNRTRRKVTKRVAYSPEPTASQHLKKPAPEPKVSTNNSKPKSNKDEKKAPVPRKSLPAILDAPKPINDAFNKSAIQLSSENIQKQPTPEIKGKRIKLKSIADLPSASNGIKLKKDVPEKIETPKEQIFPKPSKKKETKETPPRKGLLALKRYIPPPEDETSIPQTSQSLLLPSSSSTQNHLNKLSIKEKDSVPVEAEEIPINNTSPKVTEIEKSPFKEIENDKINLMVDERNDSVPEKFEPQLRKEENGAAAETSNIPPLIENTPTTTTVDVNDIVITEESKNENVISEKPKKSPKKVTPLKISLKNRLSISSLPTKSVPVIPERSSSGRTRKPAKSKEYPGHEDALPTSSNTIRRRSKNAKSIMPNL